MMCSKNRKARCNSGCNEPRNSFLHLRQNERDKVIRNFEYDQNHLQFRININNTG